MRGIQTYAWDVALKVRGAFLCVVIIAPFFVATQSLAAECATAIFEDKSAALTLPDIIERALPFDEELLKSKQNLRYSRSNFWIRLKCANSSNIAWNGVVEIDYSLLDTVDVYSGSGLYPLLYQMGDNQPFSLRPIAYRHPAVPVAVDANAETILYLKVASTGSVQVPMKIRSYEQFVSYVTDEYLVLGLYNGIVGVMFLIIFSLAVNLKERFYWFQLGYLAVFHLLQATVNGLNFQYIWTASSWLNNHAPMFLASWSSALAILFSREYLRTREFFPRTDVFIRGVAFICAVLPVLGLILARNQVNALASPTGLVVAVILTVVGVMSLPKGIGFAGYFVAGWVCMLTGIFISAMKGMGLLPVSFITNYGMQLGGLAEMILLAIGFTWRLRESERLKREIEKIAASQQRENVKLEAIAKTAQLLAHDIRKPFSLVRMASGMLTRTKSPMDIASLLEKLGPQLSKSEKSIERMLSDLLEATAQPTSYREEVEVSAVVDHVMAFMTDQIHDAGITFFTNFAHSGKIWADPARMQRALMNIVQNACQATGRHGLVWIETRSDGQQVEIVVGNAGSFVAPDLREKIFEMNFTVGKSGGTGLGLAITRKIITEHEGSVICVSDLEKGTEFKIVLPVLQEMNILRERVT